MTNQTILKAILVRNEFKEIFKYKKMDIYDFIKKTSYDKHYCF